VGGASASRIKGGFTATESVGHDLSIEERSVCKFMGSYGEASLLARKIELTLLNSVLMGSIAGFTIGFMASLYDGGADTRALCTWWGGSATLGLLIGISSWLFSDRHKYFRFFRGACAAICGIVLFTASVLGFWDSRLWQWAQHEMGVVAAFTFIGLLSMPFCLTLGAIWAFVLAVRSVIALRWTKEKAIPLSDWDLPDP